MSRRIEVELTSERGDGTWTWRAAGARQPRGVLDGTLLPSAAKVGDVLRAEANIDLDGITVTAVLPTKGTRTEPERLDVVGPAREFTPVTSTWSGRDGGDRTDRGERTRRDRPDGRGPRRDGPDRGRPPRGERPLAPDRTDRQRRPSRPREATGERSTPPSPTGSFPRADGPPRSGEARQRERRPAPPPKPKPKKLRAGRAHRQALLASLPPERRAVADQLLRGGLPAVRSALEEQNRAARAASMPEVPADPVLALAEQLLPSVRVADWRDRAEAAEADAEELSLRDLRSVVVSADDVARDETTRELAGRLRATLDHRTVAEHEEWLRELRSALDEGRLVRALRVSARPPNPGDTLPGDLATRLGEAAGLAMTAEIAPDRWAILLDAVAYSPVRRSVTPQGVPAEPGEALLTSVRSHAGRAPGIASLFGIEVPTTRPSRPGGRQPGTSTRGRATGAPPRGGPPARPTTPPRQPGPPGRPGPRRIPPPPRPPGPPGPPPGAAPVAAASAPPVLPDPATAFDPVEAVVVADQVPEITGGPADPDANVASAGPAVTADRAEPADQVREQTGGPAAPSATTEPTAMAEPTATPEPAVDAEHCATAEPTATPEPAVPAEPEATKPAAAADPGATADPLRDQTAKPAGPEPAPAVACEPVGTDDSGEPSRREPTSPDAPPVDPAPPPPIPLPAAGPAPAEAPPARDPLERLGAPDGDPTDRAAAPLAGPAAPPPPDPST